MAKQSWTLTYEKRPWTLNVERSGNRWKRAALVKEWREAFGKLVLEAKIPPLQSIEVEIHQEVPNRRSIPDCASCLPAAKAAIDSLVDMGILPDDGPEYVKTLKFYAAEVVKRDAFIMTIYGDLA